MNQIVTSGIVLTRTNYQEADRILTVLTPDHGKVRLLAKGVRKSKSKMAGGIELFGVAEISFIRGKGELATLTSSRLKTYYEKIVNDINRTMLGYELIKLLNKATEDETGAEYFELLKHAFEALNDRVDPDIIRLWFYAQLLKLAGHSPNVQTDANGQRLVAGKSYMFGYDDMAFSEHPNGSFGANEIKFVRLSFAAEKPQLLQRVTGVNKLAGNCLQLLKTALGTYVKIS